jgi:hypothetical protein
MTSQIDRTQNAVSRERRRRQRREVGTLDNALGERRFAYALAGVGMIVLPSEAMAKIVYTPAHDSTQGNEMGINIDLNHDGIPDFNVHVREFSSVFYLNVYPQVTGNQIIGHYGSASALAPGAYIGPGAKFSAYAHLMALSASGFYRGPWVNARHHYLGLEFLAAGKLHFGWARLNVEGFEATLTGYAYETVPNRPLKAGLTQSGEDIGALIPHTLLPQATATFQPASLGLLAQGASGLVAWRREEEA